MTVRRYAARVDSNQSEIRDALHKAGTWTYYIREPVDLICATWSELVRPDGSAVRVRTIWLAELKVGKPRYTPAQKRFLEEAGLLELPIYTLTSPEQAVEVAQRVRAGQ